MNSISLWQVLDIVLKRIWIIILVAALFAGVTYLYCENFVEPTYLAESAVLSTNGGITKEEAESLETSSNTSSKIGSSDITSSLNLVDTYVDILKTYSFYEELARQDELQYFGYTPTQLQRMATIERRSDYSMFIDIGVRCSDAQRAIVIANSIANLAPTYAQSMISNSYVLPADRCIKATLTSPLTTRNAILMGLVGAFLTVALFVLLAATDNTIKSEEEITERYNVAVLGIIPDFDTKSSKGAKK